MYNSARGMWLACLVVALVMMFTSRFEYPVATKIFTAAMLLIALGCVFLWRRSAKGSVSRSFSVTLFALSLILGALSLVPTGVTEWG